MLEELDTRDLGEVWRAVGPEGRPVAIRIVELLTVESAEEVVRTLQFLKDHDHPNVAEIHGAWVKDENGVLVPSPHAVGSGDLISGTIAPRPGGPFIDESRPAELIFATTDVGHRAELFVATTPGEMTLHGRFEQRRREGHADIPTAELLSYLADTADALDYLANRCNCRHYGIKPQSVLIVGGRAKVCDFGLLRLLEHRSPAAFGTQAYLAPELLEGNTPNERTDLFSLAVIYYEMSTGRLPFLETASAPHSAVSTVRQSRSPRLEAIPSAQAQVLRRAMSDNPSLRHATAREFVGELRKAVETAPRGSTARDSKGRTVYREGDVPVPGYRLVRSLGAGSFGEVWRADGPGGKSVALKISRFKTDRSMADELRALLALKEFNHPNMAEIHGFWIKDENGEWVAPPERAGLDAFRETYMSGSNPSRKPTEGELFIAMTLGEKTLYDRLRQCKDEGQSGIPVDELLRYMADAADALDYLTGHYELQHCDIKPQNILIVAGHAKICDFGLLRMASNRKTQGMGTPAYSPPELLGGSGANPQTDLYSLATSYYELRTGELPFFEADTRSTTCVIAAKQSNRLRIEDVSPGEEQVLRKAMAADPLKRYATSQEMIAALRRAATVKSGRGRTAGRLFSSAVVLGLVTAIAIVGYRKWHALPRVVPDQTGSNTRIERPKPAEAGSQDKVAAAPTQSNSPKQTIAPEQSKVETPTEPLRSTHSDTAGDRLANSGKQLEDAEKQLNGTTDWESSEVKFRNVKNDLDRMTLEGDKDKEVSRELKTRAVLGLAQVIARRRNPTWESVQTSLSTIDPDNRLEPGLRARFLLLNMRRLPPNDMFLCSKELFSLFDKEPTSYSQLSDSEKLQWDEAEQRLIARDDPLVDSLFPDRSLRELLRDCHTALGETASGERRFNKADELLERARDGLRQLETRLGDATRPMLKVRLGERKAELQDLSIALRLSSGQVKSPEEFGDLVTGKQRSRLWGQEPWKALAAAIETWYLASDEKLFSAAVNALVNSNDPSVDAAMKSKAAQLQTRFWVLRRPKDESQVQPILDVLGDRISVDPVTLAFSIEWNLNKIGGISSSERPAQLPQEFQDQWKPKVDCLAKVTGPYEPRFAGYPEYVLGQWDRATGYDRNAGVHDAGVHTLKASEPLLAERYWSFLHAGRCLFPPMSAEPLPDPALQATASSGSTTIVDVPGWADDERRVAMVFALNYAAEVAGLPTNAHFRRSDEPLRAPQSAVRYILRAVTLQKDATSSGTIYNNILRAMLVQSWPMDKTPSAIYEKAREAAEIAVRPNLEEATRGNIEIPVLLGYGVVRARQYRVTRDDQCRKDAVAAFQECLRRVYGPGRELEGVDDLFRRESEGVNDLAVYPRLVNNAVQEIEGWKQNLGQLPSEEKSQIAFLFAAKGRLLQRTPWLDGNNKGESETFKKVREAFRQARELDPKEIEYRVGNARSLYDLWENGDLQDDECKAAYEDFKIAVEELRQDGDAVKKNAAALGLLGLADFVSSRQPDCRDLSKKVEFLKTCLASTAQALEVIKAEPKQADEYQAVLLETASKAHHGLALYELPLKLDEADEDEPKKEGTTAWNYSMAVKLAIEATELQNRRDPEDAHMCCGNAMEDQALYLCRIDRYEKAIEEFKEAAKISRRVKQKSKSLMNLGRCTLRYATARDAKTKVWLLSPEDRMRQLLEVIVELEKAQDVSRNENSPDKAEAYFWIAETCVAINNFASKDKLKEVEGRKDEFGNKADKSYSEAYKLAYELSRSTHSPAQANAYRARANEYRRLYAWFRTNADDELAYLRGNELRNDPAMFVSYLFDVPFKMIRLEIRKNETDLEKEKREGLRKLVGDADTLCEGKECPPATRLQLHYMHAAIEKADLKQLDPSKASDKYSETYDKFVGRLKADLQLVEDEIKEPAEKRRWQNYLHRLLFAAASDDCDSRLKTVMAREDLNHGLSALEALVSGLDGEVQKELGRLSNPQEDQTKMREDWSACMTAQIEGHLITSFDLRYELARQFANFKAEDDDVKANEIGRPLLALEAPEALPDPNSVHSQALRTRLKALREFLRDKPSPAAKPN